MGRKLFVLGLGYVGTRTAESLVREGGWTVEGSVRNKDAVPSFASKGITAHYLDTAADADVNELRRAAAEALAGTTHLLVTAGPDDNGDPFLAHLSETLASLAKSVVWVGYLSTTGTYGDKDGAWIDETSEVNPTSKRGKRRMEAESAWVRTGLPVHVFRLPGIYGPLRGPIERVRSGQARRIFKEGQYFSRIHVDDIVQTLRASMDKPTPGEVFNVCDDEPGPGHVVIEHACALLGIEPPPLVPIEVAELSPMARSFYAENKRVMNAKIKAVLGIKLRYPTYREGQAAQLAEEISMGLAAPAPSAPPQIDSRGVVAAPTSLVGRLTARLGSLGSLLLSVPGLGRLVRAVGSWLFWPLLRWFGFGRAPSAGPRALPVPIAAPHRPPRRTFEANETAVVLVDNGSLRAASALNLRRVATEFAMHISTPVFPASMQHSDRISPSQLGGTPADTIGGMLRELIAGGCKNIVVVPFMLGPTFALTESLPELAGSLTRANPGVSIRIASNLVRKDDDRVALIMADHVVSAIGKLPRAGDLRPTVVLVDHGSPVPEVGQAREVLAEQMRLLLGDRVKCVIASSMERREGEEFAFNEPLFADALMRPDVRTAGDVIVSMAFLSPGRHAGKNGDISKIIGEVHRKIAEQGGDASALRCHVTFLVGEHALIVKVLADRYREALQRAPVPPAQAH